ncbi:MAG: 3'(2'),5'-bisphosphate nucleotidase CysQ [Rhizobiales bacterium 24-66-13]|jgi:myo-inositol-1(or 4)-monophosphatase|uniref:3'(2'),5'-bisphosphate nucleotidase CysQ n=1 Tax=Roseixanthobacter finlandensis TaxID=3119922 RepID=UPI000BD97369|nr:MAG: 3'(2'),5'-bisphosphate nucleotidase CysQ [Azorhizobium sp. 12-66-6]OYZ81894.1 MAG: 3'(2'),5'-bisphosphate nucleotidase CysQ [Rhizobiales bacterium 24-66-13]OZB02883.1 MAG: 3'(2'),5'-bisphosphate nucleotidase CysQ [Rhizobiales bacterium 39-66-18]
MSLLDPPTATGASEPAIEVPAIAARHLADAVAAAGAIALAMFRTGVTSWTKDNDSPVTEADIAVDRFLRERLTALAVDYGWLSEESADSAERLGARRVWVVDPIDGTRGFMAGGADWVVSAALVENGRPIAGALFAPVSDELFVASLGGGATRNGAAIVAGARVAVAGSVVAGPTSILDRVARHTSVTRPPRLRSLALRLARVATGELDIALAHGNSADWDIAAADLIVHEAGGLLTGLDGTAPIYNAPVPLHRPLVCAGTALHAHTLALAQREFGAIF